MTIKIVGRTEGPFASRTGVNDLGVLSGAALFATFVLGQLLMPRELERTEWAGYKFGGRCGRDSRNLGQCANLFVNFLAVILRLIG